MSRKLFAALVVLVVLVILLCASPAQAVTIGGDYEEGQPEAVLDALGSWSDLYWLESQIGWVPEFQDPYFTIPAHYGIYVFFTDLVPSAASAPGGIILVNPGRPTTTMLQTSVLHETGHQIYYVMANYDWDEEWQEIVPEDLSQPPYTLTSEHFAECARMGLWDEEYQDPNYIRTIRTEIDPAGTAVFIGSFMDAVTPEITVTQPVGSIYQQNHSIYVEFDLGDYTPATGQWCFWVRQLPDTWYYMGSRSANGADHYQQTITLNIPVGTQYQAIVGYRPHADVGDFIAWGTSPGLFGVNP